MGDVLFFLSFASFCLVIGSNLTRSSFFLKGDMLIRVIGVSTLLNIGIYRKEFILSKALPKSQNIGSLSIT